MNVTKDVLEVLIAGLRLERPVMSDKDARYILAYLKTNKRPIGFKCAVMSQQYNISFQFMYNFMRRYL